MVRSEEKRCGIAHGCRVGVVELESLGLTVGLGVVRLKGLAVSCGL